MAENRAQRRLTTILAADVVGFSGLMEADEVGTLAALKARRKEVLEPLVAKHQGRIFKLTGDGVLMEFASAVNAAQCAVELQQGMAAANHGQPQDRHIVGDDSCQAQTRRWADVAGLVLLTPTRHPSG